MEKKLKIILCILLIMLIAIVAFLGIYTKDVVIFKNNLPNYSLSTDLGRKRVTNFSTDVKEEVIYDKDGNKVDSIPEEANEDDYTKKQEAVNSDDVKTTENYKKVKKIFER